VCLSGTRARLVAYVEQVHISPNRTAAHTLGDTADRASGTQAAIIRTPPVRSKCTYGNAFVKLPAQSACAQVLAFFNTQHTKCSKQQMQFAFAIPCLDQRVCWSAQVLTLPWPIPQLASVFRAEMRDDLVRAGNEMSLRLTSLHIALFYSIFSFRPSLFVLLSLHYSHFISPAYFAISRFASSTLHSVRPVSSYLLLRSP